MSESKKQTYIHLAIFWYLENYYPRLCVSNDIKDNKYIHHLVLKTWCKLRKNESFASAIDRMKKTILIKARNKNENVEAIRKVIEDLESSFHWHNS